MFIFKLQQLIIFFISLYRKIGAKELRIKGELADIKCNDNIIFNIDLSLDKLNHLIGSNINLDSVLCKPYKTVELENLLVNLRSYLEVSRACLLDGNLNQVKKSNLKEFLENIGYRKLVYKGVIDKDFLISSCMTYFSEPNASVNCNSYVNV